MTKYDIKRDLKQCYGATNTAWQLAEVPRQQFVAVEGHGDPNTSALYAEAVEALFSVAYTIKFASKNALDRDFVVGPLEGLWWADDPAAFTTREKDAWSWRLLIAQPDWVTETMIDDARQSALAKRALSAIDTLHHHVLEEGTSAQLLHVGPYDDEGPALERLHHQYLLENGLRLAGLHHEIYLSDARRTEPAKLRTILRQPVEPDA